MVIRWRRQTGRWMKIMWLNELSVFSGSNFRPVSRIKYWQSMSLQTARAWTHWHSAQNFSFPVYIAFFFFFFMMWISYRELAGMMVELQAEGCHASDCFTRAKTHPKDVSSASLMTLKRLLLTSFFQRLSQRSPFWRPRDILTGCKIKVSAS